MLELERTDLSPRELACRYTDEKRYFVSESSVYRILRAADLITNSAYVSSELREYLGERGMAYTRGAPYPPQTQGKIERDHRSMKHVVKLQHYYFPGELESAIGDFVAYYNQERYHESLDNVTPADVYFGRQHAVLTERSKIKRRTMERRKKEYLASKAA